MISEVCYQVDSALDRGSLQASEKMEEEGKELKHRVVDGECRRAEAESGDSALPSGSGLRGAVGWSPPRFY